VDKTPDQLKAKLTALKKEKALQPALQQATSQLRNTAHAQSPFRRHAAREHILNDNRNRRKRC